MRAAPRMARYSASYPEETEIRRTKGAMVPNTAMDRRYIRMDLRIVSLPA